MKDSVLSQSINLEKKMRRSELIGPSYWNVSDFGFAQYEHGYSKTTLDNFLNTANDLQSKHAKKRHLNLSYIRVFHEIEPPEVICHLMLTILSSIGYGLIACCIIRRWHSRNLEGARLGKAVSIKESISILAATPKSEI